MLNIRSKVKLLLIFVFLTSSNHYALDLDINVISNYTSRQLVQANNSWWETITSFFGLNRKAKVNNNFQDVPPTTSSPNTGSSPNTNDDSAKSLEQTQEALENQANAVISTGTVTNNLPHKDVSTINARNNSSGSFINLDSNTLPKVNDNNPAGDNNDDVELPDLFEDLVDSKASENTNEQDILAVNEHYNLQVNIDQNSKDEQQNLDTMSENIAPNYDRKYTPIRRNTTPRGQEILKLVQPLAPQPTDQDNNQIKSDLKQNDINNSVDINNQEETIASSKISPLQSDNSDVEPTEYASSNIVTTQTDPSTQELHTDDTNQIINVHDGNDNKDSSSADHISSAEHANAVDGSNRLDSTEDMVDHNNINYTQDNKELDQKIVDANNNIYNPIDIKDDAKNSDGNINNNAKSTIDPHLEQSSSSNAKLPISDEEKIATDSTDIIANSEDVYGSTTQSDLDKVQEQKPPATTTQSLSPIDESLEQNQEQKINTTELLHNSIEKSNQKIDNVNIDIFINEELIDLARDDNNDMILGSLTQDAALMLMDDSEYSKMIEQKLEHNREGHKLQGVNNIINYHRSKINMSKKQQNNLQSQRQALSQAYRSIEQNEINDLRTILDFYPNVDSPDNDGNWLLHAAAKSDRYTLSKLLIFKGSKVNVSNNDGFTPLSIAIMNKNKGLIHLFYTIQKIQQ